MLTTRNVGGWCAAVDQVERSHFVKRPVHQHGELESIEGPVHHHGQLESIEGCVYVTSVCLSVSVRG